MSTRQVAIAAGVNWRSAKQVLDVGGNPELETIRKVEALVPRDFEPDRPSAELEPVDLIGRPA